MKKITQKSTWSSSTAPQQCPSQLCTRIGVLSRCLTGGVWEFTRYGVEKTRRQWCFRRNTPFASKHSNQCLQCSVLWFYYWYNSYAINAVIVYWLFKYYKTGGVLIYPIKGILSWSPASGPTNSPSADILLLGLWHIRSPSADRGCAWTIIILPTPWTLSPPFPRHLKI